jgi:predicted RNase H-like HicB family nuclease
MASPLLPEQSLHAERRLPWRLRHKIFTEEVMTMQNEYTAVVKQGDDWWVGWIEEVAGVNCQEKTYEELKETLVITLREALAFNRQDAQAAAGSGFKEEKIAI